MMEIQTAIIIITLAITIIGVGFTIITRAADDKVEMIKEFHHVGNSLRLEVKAYTTSIRDDFDKLERKVDNYTRDVSHTLELIQEGQAELLIKLSEKGIPPYLDSYIETHVEKAFQNREASK